MKEKILGLLGIMRRASSLSPGEDRASEAVLDGKARLLLLPEDVSEKKRERAERYVEGRSCLVLELPVSGAELSGAVGTGGCTMASVNDLGFADALMKLLAASDNDRYRAAADEITAKLEKQKKRKISKPGTVSGKK